MSVAHSATNAVLLAAYATPECGENRHAAYEETTTTWPPALFRRSGSTASTIAATPVRFVATTSVKSTMLWSRQYRAGVLSPADRTRSVTLPHRSSMAA